MPSGCTSSEGLPLAIDGQISSMCAPSTRLRFGIEVIGVILHERGAALQAGGHDFHRAHQRAGLPVAFGAEAIAVGHQPLRRNARQLRQPVQDLQRCR